MAKKKEQEEVESMKNGIGVGVFFDANIKRYVLAQIDMMDDGTAVITATKTLTGSKLGAGVHAKVALDQALDKLK